LTRLVEEKRDDIARLCRRYAVRRLELFGSATGEDFDSETSDLDFLVEFQPLQPGEYADAYFGLLEGLHQLFGRPVDLVMPRAVKNPYFLEAMNQSRTLLYAA
jgi:hypothetical protein